MVKPSPRAAPAAGAARGDQVRVTRQRILRAARELILRRGYYDTTIGAIAQRARVSPQTVYNTIGGKAALLRAVYDVALAGDDEPVPVGGRPAFEDILDAPDARTMLARYARLGRTMLDRAGPIIVAVIVEGPGRDPDLRAFLATIEGERRSGTAGMAHHLATRFTLRDGLTQTEAADVLWALTAPELADRMLRRCGWTMDRYEQWLAATMADTLVGP